MPQLCACNCGGELRPGAKHEYLRGHKPKKDKNKRVCGCGCGTQLVNRHPFIKGHAPADKGQLNGRRGPKKHTNGHANGHGNKKAHTNGHEGNEGTITIGEEPLDRFWAGLSVQEKADLFALTLQVSK